MILQRSNSEVSQYNNIRINHICNSNRIHIRKAPTADWEQTLELHFYLFKGTLKKNSFTHRNGKLSLQRKRWDLLVHIVVWFSFKVCPIMYFLKPLIQLVWTCEEIKFHHIMSTSCLLFHFKINQILKSQNCKKESKLSTKKMEFWFHLICFHQMHNHFWENVGPLRHKYTLRRYWQLSNKKLLLSLIKV